VEGGFDREEMKELVLESSFVVHRSEEDTMHVCRDAAAAGVEAVELFCGVGHGREGCGKQKERANEMASDRHGTKRQSSITRTLDSLRIAAG
jgi:hypothetical protein